MQTLFHAENKFEKDLHNMLNVVIGMVMDGKAAFRDKPIVLSLTK